MKRLLEDAKKLVRLKSVTPEGNEEVANFCMGLLQERGFKTTLQQVTHSVEDFSKRQFNVLGVLGDPLVDKKIRKGFLLASHLDTAAPGLLEAWTETSGDPFSLTQKEGRLFGLGVSESKMDFLCKLYAATKFREKKLKMPIYLVGTCGGEVGMFGSRYLVKAGTLNPKYVMVGASTGLQLVHSHKCQILLKVSINYQQIERDARGFNRKIDLYSLGRTAHSSNPQLGQNALESSFRFLEHAVENGFDLRFTQFQGGASLNQVPDQSHVQFYLTSHQFEDFKRFFREVVRNQGQEKAFKVDLGGVGDTGVRFVPENLFECVQRVLEFFSTVQKDFSKVKNDQYEPPFSTLNFSRMKQKPAGIDLFFDIRLLPELVVEEIEKHIQAGIQKLAAHYPSLNLILTRERMGPGLQIPQDHPWIMQVQDSLKSLGLDSTPHLKASATEAAVFAQAGYDSLAFGPGQSIGNSHGPNESCTLEEIEKTIHFYEHLIERVCV